MRYLKSAILLMFSGLLSPAISSADIIQVNFAGTGGVVDDSGPFLQGSLSSTFTGSLTYSTDAVQTSAAPLTYTPSFFEMSVDFGGDVFQTASTSGGYYEIDFPGQVSFFGGPPAQTPLAPMSFLDFPGINFESFHITFGNYGDPLPGDATDFPPDLSLNGDYAGLAIGIYDGNGNDFYAGGGLTSWSSQSVEGSAAPEPSTFLISGAALTGLLGVNLLRQRRGLRIHPTAAEATP